MQWVFQVVDVHISWCPSCWLELGLILRRVSFLIFDSPQIISKKANENIARSYWILRVLLTFTKSLRLSLSLNCVFRVFFKCNSLHYVFARVCTLGEDHRALKGPKGAGRQRAPGWSGLVQEGEQGSEGEGQQPADRINREGGQQVCMEQRELCVYMAAYCSLAVPWYVSLLGCAVQYILSAGLYILCQLGLLRPTLNLC